MKKIKLTNKLNLNKRTISELNILNSTHAKGGAIPKTKQMKCNGGDTMGVCATSMGASCFKYCPPTM